ncbi:hypothetical protein [Streptosporangium sp. OZ121]|uniref:hypothetical protein n=1 Tax=Streptosporangium sp. OZ121 TaxID=3444183 RepID=UPI003F798B4E
MNTGSQVVLGDVDTLIAELEAEYTLVRDLDETTSANKGTDICRTWGGDDFTRYCCVTK